MNFVCGCGYSTSSECLMNNHLYVEHGVRKFPKEFGR